MNWKLSLLAVGAVLLASCIGERREAPAERCGEPPAAACSDTLENVLVGPGTFPLGTAYPRVFDVPAGARVQARLVYPGQLEDRALGFTWSWSSERARHGLDREPVLLLDYDQWNPDPGRGDGFRTPHQHSQGQGDRPHDHQEPDDRP